MTNIAVVIITVDTPKRNAYCKETLRSLVRGGVKDVDIASHAPGERTATENVAAALAKGVHQGKQWVLFLEDDIEVCDDFADRVSQWLAAYARADRHVYSFSCPHQELGSIKGDAWEYPIDRFCCTQAFALRTEDAASLYYYLLAHPTYTGADGIVSTAGYDLSMREWAKVTWPEVDYFLASNPAFVQHVGVESVIAPGRESPVMMSWNREGTARTPRMLWVGDAACPSGFARSTHGVLATLYKEYDVTVLGINYNGDPHDHPYPIYACAAGGDAFGVKRLIWMCDKVKPDVIVIQQDPWNFPHYLNQLAKFSEYRGIPVVGVVAVDGKNCRGSMLNGLSLAIFWTQFGLDEARLGGYTGPAAIVPLGVDLEQYYPMDRQEVRIKHGLSKDLLDAFIIGNVNRNQPRKRLDLMIEYVGEWQRRSGVKDAYLWMHVAPTGDTDGIDVMQYAKYHGVKLIYVAPAAFYGVTEDTMRETYNIFDVAFTASQGEGFGLTAFEAMACGVPVIASDWAALGELCEGAAYLIPCSGTSITMSGGINSIGGVMDKELAIKALDELYKSRSSREWYQRGGLSRVREDRFRWENIGRLFGDSIEVAMGGQLNPQLPHAKFRGIDPIYINGIQSNSHVEMTT